MAAVSKQKFDISKLRDELTKLSQKQSFEDDRFWYPKRDKSGNAHALIRFLPAGADEPIPFVRYWHHGFEVNGKWYIENCPTTLNGKCPCCELNNELWNSGKESDKKIVSVRKRKLTYISNILVIDDPESPENNGKVFLFKYGKKILDKINSAANPEFKDDPAINAFAVDGDGANFKFKVRQFEGYANYDKSDFDKLAAIPAATWKAIEPKLHPLSEFVDPKKFKSESELRASLARVVGGGIVGNSSNAGAPKNRHTAQVAAAEAAFGSDEDGVPSETLETVTAGGEEVSGIDYFKKLADEE